MLRLVLGSFDRTFDKEDAKDILRKSAKDGADLSVIKIYDQSGDPISADEVVDFSVFEATVSEPEKVLEIIQDHI